MTQIRDRNARDDYARMEGIIEGHTSGFAKGLTTGEDRMNRLVLNLIQAGRQEDIEKRQKIRNVEIFTIAKPSKGL